jgi:septum formation protein
MQQIVLASGSPYRRQLLDKLGLLYDWKAPNIDETPKDEKPDELVRRLAFEKAKALAKDFPDALIIGSDQIALLDGEILGKPGNHAIAHKQLSMASGKPVTFLTGLCLLNTANAHAQICCETYRVFFRSLTAAQIDSYLEREQPYDCAGSFKAEGLGICLFTKLEGDDPNTLIGLPLITLIDMLNKEGINIPG